MDYPPDMVLRIGAWRVEPAHHRMSRGDDVVRLEPRTMRLLLLLADHAGTTVSAEQMLATVWPGVIVTPDSVYQAVASLRRLLGDDPKQPAYIVTVPREGYRMVAVVEPWRGSEAPARSPRKTLLIGALAVAAVLAGVLVALVPGRNANVPPVAAPARIAIAVLPFLDLTEAMGQEIFADGMTEALIDKLAKNPRLQVPAPKASFYYKEKQLPLAQIAQELHAAYVLDGSVRQSEATLRVAVRLVRADDGFVVWSETYDRPASGLVKVQDDIAGEVALLLARDPGLGRDRAETPKQ